jgi:hypothetical protein
MTVDRITEAVVVTKERSGGRGRGNRAGDRLRYSADAMCGATRKSQRSKPSQIPKLLPHLWEELG